MQKPPPSASDLAAAGVEVEPPYLERVPLEGEGSDRAYRTRKGTLLRAKVQITHRQVRLPADNMDPEAASSTASTLSISLSELNTDMSVKQSGGRFLIFDRHELLVSEEALSRPGFDLAAEIDHVIEDLARKADAVRVGKAKARALLLSEWGEHF